MGKGEITCKEQFFLFPKCFLPIWRTFCHITLFDLEIRPKKLQVQHCLRLLGPSQKENVDHRSLSIFCAVSAWSTLAAKQTIVVKGALTHYQTTNFRLFQTERVCRRQFRIWRKWQNVTEMGRKHCGKRRNCSLPAISPFPTVFSKGLFPRGIKRCHCEGIG